MSNKPVQLDGLGALLAALCVLIVLMFAPAVIFAIKGDRVGFAISVTVIAMLFLGLLVMGAVAVGASYTKSTMKEGAQIALASQDFNDRWDVQKFKSATTLMVEGARIAKSLQQPDIPALPMPSQGLDWLPRVSLLEDVNAGEWDGD